ncbi:MBL fold metallo-hydrolase [Chryseolinea sp. H1M3-3]|uniref:MBL fold metallo-hydrolase n=1 Tax=Chryseolinea sp. H1M3-3 TaxID=3034144 RepID=UPI0023EB9FB3|nr:MBL fold metallo-hydrolase [Chryseolinea sp. H1M3-3]
MKDNKLMSTEELQKKLERKEPVFILDVRPVEQRNEWRIGESTHVDAYKRLNAGDNTVLDEVDIPKDSTVVTVCAAGRTSLIASEALREKGFQAYSLEGGMKAWNYAWNTAEFNFQDGLKVIQVRRTAKGVLSYIVGSANEAIVIDACLNPEIYLKLSKENGWSIKYVLDTHIHADFVSRSRELARAGGATHLLIDKAKAEFEFNPAASGDIVRFGTASLQFIHTPGHTWESTTFKLNDLAIFTGDTLFIDGIGRPDLKADQHEAMQKAKSLYHSLKQLLSLPSSILVLPAHTAKTVLFDGRIIGEPLANVKKSVHVSELSESQFVEYASSKIPPTPPNYQLIAGLNVSGSYDGYELSDLEAGGNHCAIA